MKKNEPIVQDKKVVVGKSGDQLKLTWNNLHVKAKTKPYAEKVSLVLK